MQTMSILAQSVSFFDSSIGGLVKALLMFAGTAFVLFSVIAAVKSFAGGKQSEGARKIVVALLVGAFCFRPEMILGIINLFASIADAIFGDGGDVERIVSDSGITVD